MASDDPYENYKQNPIETQLEHLAIYIAKRAADTRGYDIPIFSKLFGGYSRTQKLAAVEALQTSLQNPTTFFPSAIHGHLKQGQLKKVIEAWGNRSEKLLSNLIC